MRRTAADAACHQIPELHWSSPTARQRQTSSPWTKSYECFASAFLPSRPNKPPQTGQSPAKYTVGQRQSPAVETATSVMPHRSRAPTHTTTILAHP